MYQLGIRKQDTDWIMVCSFDRKEQIDYMLDQADAADCKEAIVLLAHTAQAVAYKEFRRKTK